MLLQGEGGRVWGDNRPLEGFIMWDDVWNDVFGALELLAFVICFTGAVLFLVVGVKLLRNMGKSHFDSDYRHVIAVDLKTNKWKTVKVPTQSFIRRMLE